jgi:hypothetical protein
MAGYLEGDAEELLWRVTVPSCASWAVGVKVAQIPAIFALFGRLHAESQFVTRERERWAEGGRETID